MEILKEVLGGKHVPWIDRFIKLTGKAMDRFAMAAQNETVLTGISGGKDSLSLLFALRMLQKYHGKKFQLRALFLDWQEYPAGEANIAGLNHYCNVLEIPFSVKKCSAFRLCGADDFSCYFCARERKVMMFKAAEETGINTIAFGHHLDDHIETSLMNLFLRAKLDPMQPISSFFNDKYFVIRPLCLVSENVVRNIASALALPVFSLDCPYRETNIRVHFKPLVSGLVKMDKNVKDHIFTAYSDYYRQKPAGMDK